MSRAGQRRVDALVDEHGRPLPPHLPQPPPAEPLQHPGSMRRVVEFTVYGVALSKGNVKSNVIWRRDDVTGRRIPIPITRHANPELREWEKTITAAIQKAAPGVFFKQGEPVAVRLEFHMPRPKSAPKRVVLPTVAPDLDKLIRGALDACSGPLWHDDSQVVHVQAWKVYAVDRPKVIYHITDAVELQPPAQEWTQSLF